MTVLEKVLFLEKSYNLSDRAFCSKFRIKYGTLRKWKANEIKPESKFLFYLCCQLNLDINDFMSDSSTLSKETMKDGEHLCKVHEKNRHESMVSEDFPREDNSRYEEKD